MLSNVCSTNDEVYLDYLSKSDFYEHMTDILHTTKIALTTRTLFGLSNLIADNPNQASRFFFTNKLTDRVLFLCKNCNVNIAKEASFVITAAIQMADMEVLRQQWQVRGTDLVDYLAMILFQAAKNQRLALQTLRAMESFMRLESEDAHKLYDNKHFSYYF